MTAPAWMRRRVNSFSNVGYAATNESRDRAWGSQSSGILPICTTAQSHWVAPRLAARSPGPGGREVLTLRRAGGGRDATVLIRVLAPLLGLLLTAQTPAPQSPATPAVPDFSQEAFVIEQS